MTNGVVGKITGLFVTCDKEGITSCVVILYKADSIYVAIKNTPYSESQWACYVGQKAHITSIHKENGSAHDKPVLTARLVVSTAMSACPEKIGKYLIQVTKPLPYSKAANCFAVKTGDCKLWKVTEDKYLVIRSVKPDDNANIIDLEDGDWQDRLIVV